MNEQRANETEACGLTQAQAQSVDAVARALRDHGQAALAGYAGTGKTWTTGHIVRRALARGRSVLVCAPTHKALAQLQPRLPDGVDTMTLTRALGLRVVDHDDGSTGTARAIPPCVAGYDLVIIDEASMVSAEAYEAMQALRGNAKVLWVGDPAQLPPVGEAESPVWARVVHQARLTEVIRQGRDSGVLALSMRIRDRLERGQRITWADVAEMADDAEDMATIRGGTSTVASAVVSAMRAGCDAIGVAWTNAAVTAINRQARAMLRQGDQRPYVPGDRVVFGRPYEWTDGDGTARRTNSATVGTIVSVSDAETDHRGVVACTVCVDVDGTRIHVQAPMDKDAHLAVVDGWKRRQAYYYGRGARGKDEFTHARNMHYAMRDHYADLRDIYASTAHKAQGSTVDVAVIHWDDCARNPDAAEAARLLYVAVTRPRSYLVFVHEDGA